MKDIPHWDVDEDYIVDVTEGHILFSAENANKQEIKLASAAPELLEALLSIIDMEHDVSEWDAVYATALGKE
ncbi:hypothetical protein AB8697_003615 [Salmonella enterica]|nr:hypothetical protein [Salmonella enterica subsp. enterica serovar Typhimurium]EDU3013450.1 hypothetical protein [Salmonella enterica subsp. enterica serovar 4,[5],12:b:-]EFR9615483.1 hypothetical protein [Salmonella enterica]EIK8820900.1 hypothetical protein [Salmonella enterica]EMC6023061.1 hypothetical protein [Salmonella enterica]